MNVLVSEAPVVGARTTGNPTPVEGVIGDSWNLLVGGCPLSETHGFLKYQGVLYTDGAHGVLDTLTHGSPFVSERRTLPFTEIAIEEGRMSPHSSMVIANAAASKFGLSAIPADLVAPLLRFGFERMVRIIDLEEAFVLFCFGHEPVYYEGHNRFLTLCRRASGQLELSTSKTDAPYQLLPPFTRWIFSRVDEKTVPFPAK
jgi:hypothetical protein